MPSPQGSVWCSTYDLVRNQTQKAAAFALQLVQHAALLLVLISEGAGDGGYKLQRLRAAPFSLVASPSSRCTDCCSLTWGSICDANKWGSDSGSDTLSGLRN
eukprot:1558171-Rhodomonas_salina.1